MTKKNLNNTELENQIHIGNLIEQQLRLQQRSVAWFARNIDYKRSNCYRIFSASSIDTQLLLRISKVLNYDFFQFYENALSKNDHKNVSI